MKWQRDIGLFKYLLEHIEQIAEYKGEYDEDAFLRDNKTKDAILTRLMVIGEYAHKVDDSLKERFSEVDWKAMKLARNFYAHVYRGIDWILVWHVVTNELPALRANVERIIEVLENEQDGKIN